MKDSVPVGNALCWCCVVDGTTPSLFPGLRTHSSCYECGVIGFLNNPSSHCSSGFPRIVHQTEGTEQSCYPYSTAPRAQSRVPISDMPWLVSLSHPSRYHSQSTASLLYRITYILTTYPCRPSVREDKGRACIRASAGITDK